MRKVSVFTNFKTVNGPFGGANSFMKTLMTELESRGFRFKSKMGRGFDLAFINALSDGVKKEDLIRLKSEYRLPIVHRKVGYTVSGGPDMREKVDGIPRGERIQLEFDPYVDYTVFQSKWSQDEFQRGGFSGHSTVIRNGVNSEIFSPFDRKGALFWQTTEERKPWVPGQKFRIAISSWSTDPNKGFSEYVRLDRELADKPGFEIWFFGRVPPGTQFRNIYMQGALSHPKLAQGLRQCHAILTLSRNETCSNSLLEGLSCGLPAVYLDSGSSREFAEPYGVEFREDFWSAFKTLQSRYAGFYEGLLKQPFRIEEVADQYEALFRKLV